MLSARTALEHAIPDARVDAAVSRQFKDAIAILDADEQLPQTIVVDLGVNSNHNDEFDEISASVEQIMKDVGPESTVFFMTVKVPRPWETSVNDALFSSVVAWPNAHVLDWRGFSLSHPDWFLRDGFHPSPVGQTAYAAFVRDGIRGPLVTRGDPFAGRAIPTTGFVVLDDPKTGTAQSPSSWAIQLVDHAGHTIAELPRAAISDETSNAQVHELVATDAGVHVAARPPETALDVPAGCTPTERDPALAVALCGPRSAQQIGDRIVVNDGSGWRDLVAAPPVPAGDQLAGHWAWAAPSPDGRWVLAGWSAECEVVTSLMVSVADGSVRAVTGEAGTAWRGAPESGFLGWSSDGRALAVFGGTPGCGTSAPARRGVYLVSPDDAARQLLLPLTPAQGIMQWSAVDDRRTR